MEAPGYRLNKSLRRMQSKQYRNGLQIYNMKRIHNQRKGLGEEMKRCRKLICARLRLSLVNSIDFTEASIDSFSL